MALMIRETLDAYHQQILNDPNHRFRSWEHCYTYFGRTDVDRDIACLHLALYLASWGMYRGSSFLLGKDYQVHQGVVDHLLQQSHLRGLDPADATAGTWDEVMELTGFIRCAYSTHGVEVITDTLVTKILLGVLGCIPAYDRFFIQGLRVSGIPYSKLSKGNLMAVVEFYSKHRQEFDQVRFTVLNKNNDFEMSYPPMKLVDMHLWQIGRLALDN